VEQLQAANADLGKRLDDTRRALTDSEASVARLVAAEAAVARLTQELDAQRAATQETADKLKAARAEVLAAEQAAAEAAREYKAHAAAADRAVMEKEQASAGASARAETLLKQKEEAYGRLLEDVQASQQAYEEAASQLRQAADDVDRLTREKTLLEALVREYAEYKADTLAKIRDLKGQVRVPRGDRACDSSLTHLHMFPRTHNAVGS
jgi:hypothetical protein